MHHVLGWRGHSGVQKITARAEAEWKVEQRGRWLFAYRDFSTSTINKRNDYVYED
jgi:hypothetical protein